MSREVELLTEIRDLLAIVAEPALEKRDAKLRAALREAVGSSPKKAAAIFLMDGSRTQSAISKETGFDSSDLSKLVRLLISKELLANDPKAPKLALKIPQDFFTQGK